MTTTSTATIETLTASVHVLRMGNRQITLGVYRQLDYMPFKDLEPLGRVRDPQQKTNGVVYIVGKSRETGQLSRAYVQQPRLDGRKRADEPLNIESLLKKYSAEPRGKLLHILEDERRYVGAKALPLIILAAR